MRIDLNDSSWLFKGYLGEDWNWRNAHRPISRDKRGWLPATVPGSVLQDLWKAGEIPDPYFERNSLLVEWVPQRTWLYKRTFFLESGSPDQQVFLRFEGVDYSAQFFLNGERLGEHHSMYTAVEFEISNQVKYGQENLIAVVLDPAPFEQPQVGRSSLVRTHKARMNYWWDFCPRMLHQGIWDDVYLYITGPVRILDAFVRTQLSDDFHQVSIKTDYSLCCLMDQVCQIQMTIRKDEEIVASYITIQQLQAGLTNLDLQISITEPELWWPNGYGEPNLYEIELRAVTTSDPTQDSDHRIIPFGIRRITFVPNETPDETARPYTLEVNGRRIYLNGWNWVPMDTQYGVRRPEKLTRLLGLAQRAQVNLLRVWGGGLIEREDFYNQCDQLGILIWQEFIQSSSGIENYPPDNPDFICWMVHEAAAIIPRKRNHPALAIWCGGNELQIENDIPAEEHHPMLAALSQVVHELDPDRLWLPTSPSGRLFGYSAENFSRDPTGVHDVHGPWEYKGIHNHQALFNQGTSLLHSEFGVEGITNARTLNTVILKHHQDPVSLDNPLWFHLGSWWVKTPSWEATFGEIDDIDQLVNATQFLQADGLRYAVEADRRRMFQNSGTMPWQFNEPFPMAACTSAVDYYALPKPVYHTVARAYAPLSVTARFPEQALGGHDTLTAQIWIACAHEKSIDPAILEQKIVGISGRVYHQNQETVAFPSNRAALINNLEQDLASISEEIIFLDLNLQSKGGQLIACNRYIFSLTKDLAPLLKVPPTGLVINNLKILQDNRLWSFSITNGGSVCALHIWLQDEHRADPRTPPAAGYAYFDDNYFCLFPGESRKVLVEWDNVSPAERKLSAKAWNSDQTLIG